MSGLNKLDWRALQRYLSPQAADDLNRFLEKMPNNVGNAVLIAAGISWISAGALGLFTTVKVEELTEKRIELAETEALKPMVPELKNRPVSKAAIEKFVKKIEGQYDGLTFSINGNTVTIVGSEPKDFWQFREAMGHMQNGGQGWRVNLENMCVGRECDKDKLRATIKINEVKVEMPVIE